MLQLVIISLPFFYKKRILTVLTNGMNNCPWSLHIMIYLLIKSF
jgi:hypothetical protein